MSDLSKTVNSASAASQKQNIYDHAVAVLHNQIHSDMDTTDLQNVFLEAGENGNPQAYLMLAEMQHKGFLNKHDVEGIKISKRQNIEFLSLALIKSGTNEPVRKEAKELLENMKQRMEDRIALMDSGKPASSSAEDLKAFKYAEEKNEQDLALLPVIQDALNEDKRLHIEQNEVYGIHNAD